MAIKHLNVPLRDITELSPAQMRDRNNNQDGMQHTFHTSNQRETLQQHETTSAKHVMGPDPNSSPHTSRHNAHSFDLHEAVLTHFPTTH